MKKISKIMIAMILLVALVMSSTAATGSLNFFSAPQDGEIASIESGGGQLVAKAATTWTVETLNAATKFVENSSNPKLGYLQIPLMTKDDVFPINDGHSEAPKLDYLNFDFRQNGKVFVSYDGIKTFSKVNYTINEFQKMTPTLGSWDTYDNTDPLLVDFVVYPSNGAGHCYSKFFIPVSAGAGDSGSNPPVKKTPDYTLVVPTNPKYGDALTLRLSNANHSGAITYKYGTTSGSYPNTFTNGSTTLGAGTYYFQASTTAGNGYKAHSATATVTIDKADQVDFKWKQGIWTYGTAVQLGKTELDNFQTPPKKYIPGAYGGNGNGAITYELGAWADGDPTLTGTATITTDGVVTVTKAGIVKFKATKAGNENYKDATVSGICEINPKDITNAASITTAIANKTYTGAAIVPADSEIALKYGAKTLTKGTDYTFEFADNTNVGENTAKCNVTFIGNYSGTQAFTWTISRLDMTHFGVGVDGFPNSAVYTAVAHAPNTTITYNGKTLVSSKDYNGEYSNNINAGKATYTVEFIGNYSGKQTFDFPIFPFDLATDTGNKFAVTGNSNVTYNAKPQQKTIAATFNGTTLKLGTDYSVAYSGEITNVGKKTITITGLKNFTNTKQVTYDITALDLSTAGITISPISSMIYTGSALNPPDPTVKFGEVTLPTSDYTVSYSNNTNAGTAAVCTITGKGNCEKAKNFTWTITADTTTSGGAFNNDGKPTTKTISEGVKYADADLGFTAKGAGATITYLYTKSGEASGIATRPTTPGEYTVTATVNDLNYGGEAAKATCALTIEDFTVTSITITPKSVDVANGTYMVDITTVLDKGYESGVGVIITGSDGIALTAPYRSETGGTGHPKTSFTNDSSALKFGVTYTFSSHIGEKKEYGDQTADLTATVVKFAIPTIQNDYSNHMFYGFEVGGKYSIANDKSGATTPVEFTPTTETPKLSNIDFQTATASIVRKGNNSTATITKDSVAADKEITYDSEPQSLKVNVGSVESVPNHVFNGTAYNPAPKLTIGGAEYTAEFTKTYKIKNGETYSTIEPANLINAGLYRVEYSGNTAEFNGIIYTTDFAITKIPVTVGTGDAAPKIAPITYGANYATLDATGSTPPISTVTNKAVAGAFTVEFTPTAEQLSTSGHLKAGTYTAKVVFTPSGVDAVNYEIMKADVSFTVTPKAITGLTFAKTYDGMAEFEYSSEAITGVLASDLVKINGSTTSANAAAYAGTAMAPGGADKDNYTFDATATLTINQAPLTFTKMDATIVKFFDGKTTTGGAQFAKGTHYSVTGLIGGEEGLTDNIKAGDGFSIVFSNSIIADNLTADVTITLPTALSNYTIAAGGTLSGYKAAINGVTVDPTKDYTMTPSTTNEKNGWYNTTVTFAPKGDYHYISNELSGSYSEALVVSDRTNAPYIFYLKVSENGAVAQVVIDNLKIDTTKPTVDAGAIVQVENKTDGKTLGGDATAIANNTKENVKITIPYVEATSGIDHIVVKVDGVEYKFTEYTNNADTNSLSFVVDKNGTYSVTLVDVAGNESKATDVIVKNIDRTLPTIEVKVNNLPVADANSKKWYGSATVTAVGSTTYAGDITAKAVIKDYDGNVTATETNTATMTIDKNGISTVIVTVTDALGNVNTMKVVVKVDKNIDTFNAMVDALTNASAENDWLTAITTFEKYTAAQKDHIMGKDANDTSKANYEKLMTWKKDHETEITGTLKEKKITELVNVIKTAIGDPDTGTITIDNIDKAIEEIKKATEETKTDPRVKDLIDEVEKLIKLKKELAKIIAPVDPTNPNKNLQVIEPGTYTQLTQIIDVYDKLDPGVEAPTSFIKEILEKLVANTDDIEPVTPPYSVKEKIDELKGKKKKIDEFVKEVDKVTPVTPTNFPTDPGSVVTPTVTSIIGQVVPTGGGMVDPGTGLVTPITGIKIPGVDPGTGTPDPEITIDIKLFPEDTKDDLEEVIDIKEVVEEIKKLIGELPDPETGIVDPTITIEVKIKEIEELIDNLKKTIDGGDGLIDGGSKKKIDDVKKKVDEVNKGKDDKDKKIDKAIVDILDVLKNIDDVSTPKEILDAKKKFDELDPDVKEKIKTGNLLDTLIPNYFDVDTEGKLIDNGTDYTDGNEVTTPDVNPDLIENANKVYVETPDPGVDPGTLPLINVIKNIDVTEVTGGKLDELKEIKKKYDDLTKDPVTNDKTTQKKLIDNDEEIKKKIDEVDKLIEKIEEVIRLVGEIPADGSPTCQICLTHDKEYHVILPEDKSVNGQTEFHKGAIDKAKMAYEKLTGDEKKYIDDVTKKIIDDGYKHLKDYLKDAAREQKVVITDTENNVSVFGIATQVDTSEVDMAADVIDIFMTAEKTDSAIEELSKDLKKVVSYDVKLWAKTNGDENTKKMIQPAAGKSVVVKLPIAADADLSTLRIYHVKGDGSRSLVYPYTISYEGGTTYAVFEVSSFSEFIAYAEKSKNSGGNIDGGGGGMTIDPGDIFWKGTEIDIGKEGETKVIIDIDKVKDKQIPKEIIEKIIDKGKDLVVKEGGKDTTLTNEDLKKLTLTENSYTLAELLALIEKANKPAVTPTPTPTEKPTEPTDPTEPTAKKCWLCGACPMFLGICLWIWLAIAIVVVAVVVIIVVRKKKKNDKNE